MKLTDTVKNALLDVLDESGSYGKYGSLHTAYSATGANEVSGGSPAYARKALTWAAASGGSKALAATLPVWDVPASTTVAWVGIFDASSAGNFVGMFPAGAMALREFTADTSDLITSKAHGYSAGQAVVFWGSALPTGLSVGTIYYVISSGLATDAFKVSATLGGSAVDLSSTGGGFVQGCVPETFTGQGTYTASSGSIDLNAVA